MLDNKMPFVIEKQEKFILDEVNGYIAKMGYTIKFNNNQMVEMLKMYLNKPLEIYELKPNLWVWDNYYKMYRQIKYVNFNAFTISFLDENLTQKYKSNRFYLREVTNES